MMTWLEANGWKAGWTALMFCVLLGLKVFGG